MSLPYFAPFKFGPFTMHAEPVHDAMMIWVYDQRITDANPLACGMETCCRLGWIDPAPKNRNHQEKLAWRYRKEIAESLLASSLPIAEGEQR